LSFQVGKGGIALTKHFRLIANGIKTTQIPILEKETDNEAKDAASAAPKRTGEMARKIYATKKDDKTFSVVADKHYTIFQERGTFRIMAKYFMQNAERRFTPIILSKLNENVANQIRQSLSGGI